MRNSCVTDTERFLWRLQGCPAGTFYTMPVDDDADSDSQDTDAEDTGAEDTGAEDSEDDDEYFVCANCPVNSLNTYSANLGSTACAACPGAPEGSSTCL